MNLQPAPRADHRQPSLSRRSFIGVTGVAALSLAVGSLPGCAGGQEGTAGTSGKTITVAFSTNGYPTSFIDEETGETSGYEVDVIKRIQDILTDYTFQFEGVDQVAAFAGLSSGKYDAALTNSFWTPERAEKYLTPEQNIGASVLGFLTRKEHEDIQTLEEAAEAKLTLAPITAGDGNYYVIQDYNDQHPDATIELTATDDPNAFTEAFGWVAEGRYDFTAVPLQYYNALVVAEDGALHQYIDTLSFRIIGATKTWSFLAKGREDFERDYSAAIKQLKDDGTLSELSKTWYDGVDNFEYLTDDSKTYNFL